MNNFYSTVSVPPNTPTIIASFTVPERGGYSFKGAIIWTNANCDLTVKYNLDTIGGGRISGSQQTIFLDYSSSPYGLDALDSIIILATQTGSVSYILNCTLLLEQL